MVFGHTTPVGEPPWCIGVPLSGAVDLHVPMAVTDLRFPAI